MRNAIAVLSVRSTYKGYGPSGFTLVELVAIIMIMGILAAVAIPRFFSGNVFNSRGFHDQVMAALRYGQKAAIAQRRLVCVTFSASSMQLGTAASFADTSCNTNLASPDGQASYVINAPSGVILGGSNFNFDAAGKPSSPLTISVSGATSIQVEAETGYVHSP